MAESDISLEVASHMALTVGRVLFQSNADTEEVHASVHRFVKALGYESHLMVTYEMLLLTVYQGEEFRTKTGNRVPSMNVNMEAVTAVLKLVDEVEDKPMDAGQLRARLEAIEHESPIYHPMVVVAGLSLTAASLSRLFGGDWPTFFVTLVAGAIGTWVRLEIGRRGANPLFVAFASAFVSGVVAGAAVLTKWSAMPALCFLAPGMIIVPGVPLVNCVKDMIKNHVSLGISRLGFAVLVTLAIAVGLFASATVTSVQIPVSETSRLPSLAGDALFSALAALGYLFLFNVPVRFAWVGVLCGIASHTTRTFCLGHGLDIVTGSFIGALAAGFLAHNFARAFRAPVSAFAFPGVVAMIPGSYAFRAVIGYLEIMKLSTAAPAGLVTETLALTVTTLLMVLAIAIGVAIPLTFQSNPVCVAALGGIGKLFQSKQ